VSNEKVAEFREALLREAERRAYFYDKFTGCCAQSTLLAIQELFGVGNEATYKAASLLFGGLSGAGHTCGALIGGMMALGLKYGREQPDVERSHVLGGNAGIRLVKWFEREYGTASCRELIGYDLTDEKARAEFLASAVHEECFQRCGKVAARVAEILTESG
jgi:C_GCAxxG_C_C family probable redox protein